MIIDVHCHAWDPALHLTADFHRQASRARGGVEMDLATTYQRYRDNAPPDTRTIVFGGKARLSGCWVPDAYVAEFVRQDPQRLIGFLALDPTQDGWQREMREGREQLGLRGIKLMPMYAGFRPDDRMLDPMWEYSQQHGLPVLLHTGTTFIAQAPLACTLPRHLDPVATRFPR